MRGVSKLFVVHFSCNDKRKMPSQNPHQVKLFVNCWSQYASFANINVNQNFSVGFLLKNAIVTNNDGTIWSEKKF